MPTFPAGNWAAKLFVELEMVMENKENGGPAFPSGSAEGNKGLTLRDYFAAKAMQAVITNLGHPKDKSQLDNMAVNVYAISDAMLEARKS